mmetsp:Transcript_16195/g.41164  ORF Transcript_16195/g.41164 Transcript_16195/m.41164 type:complete len:278 (-) Transcript_16195:19-852(-)|eukprot:CAMPEP_0115458766 /NCGR_PEP_ID=MMETSP0271-20121206/45904_1 /TAXON_ID=71861 /ORGANISM="Scrippsiella trochoidea, Strain CCMP3099" /LENGTH=277 /DNA_ID=CAMNT_0002885385 /DNA_START=81 /DNA_END=914 /DNA_ORIENTATION=+
MASSSRLPPAFLLVAAFLATPVCALPKILCLHGGGGNGAGFQRSSNVAALESALSAQYQFVYADAPEAGGLWIRDAPGGKGAGTTDPNWAATSMTYLDNLVESQGPFKGILGYSQGSAFATYYLSQRQANQTAPFQFAMLFCGYIPTVHAGLTDAINAASPFHGISTLVFMGQNDFIIQNSLTSAQAEKFTSPTIVTSNVAGHDLPASSDPTFSSVTSFAETGSSSGGGGGGVSSDGGDGAAPDQGSASDADAAIATTMWTKLVLSLGCLVATWYAL